MTTAKEDAKKIREEYKALGWNSRMISVKADNYSMGSTIRVTVKHPSIDFDQAKEIANQARRVSYCQASGEILSGGNRFVDFGYDDEAIASHFPDWKEAIEEFLEDSFDDAQGTRVPFFEDSKVHVFSGGRYRIELFVDGDYVANIGTEPKYRANDFISSCWAAGLLSFGDELPAVQEETEEPQDESEATAEEASDFWSNLITIETTIEEKEGEEIMEEKTETTEEKSIEEKIQELESALSTFNAWGVEINFDEFEKAISELRSQLAPQVTKITIQSGESQFSSFKGVSFPSIETADNFFARFPFGGGPYYKVFLLVELENGESGQVKYYHGDKQPNVAAHIARCIKS